MNNMNKNIQSKIKVISITTIIILLLCLILKYFFPAEWSFITPHKQGDFVRVGNMHNHLYVSVPILLDDGRVFITNGRTTEIYNPKTRRFKEIKKDNFRKNDFPIPVKLKDGRVILIGGSNEHGNTWPDTYIFDPKTNKFEKGPDLPQALHGFFMSEVKNGNIYVWGGIKEYIENQHINLHNITVYGYDYKKNKIILTGYLEKPGHGLMSHKLNSQEVLIYDGYNSVSKNVNIEIYDLKTNKSKLVKQSLNIYENINPVFLQNNNILFAGGTSGFGISYNAHKDAKIYNPRTNTFKPSKTKLNFYRENANAIVLKDGNVLIFGGRVEPIFSLFAKQNPAEIYMFNKKIKR